MGPKGNSGLPDCNRSAPRRGQCGTGFPRHKAVKTVNLDTVNTSDRTDLKRRVLIEAECHDF